MLLLSSPSPRIARNADMARQTRQFAREDDFLSESDLSPSSADSAAEEVVRDVARREPYRDEPVRRRSKGRKRDGDRAQVTDESSLTSETDESDEEKLIGVKNVQPSSPKARKSKKSRRMWEMRSGDGAAAASAQSVSSMDRIVPVNGSNRPCSRRLRHSLFRTYSRVTRVSLSESSSLSSWSPPRRARKSHGVFCLPRYGPASDPL